MLKLEHLFIVSLDDQAQQYGGASGTSPAQIVKHPTSTSASTIIQINGSWLITRNEKPVGIIKVPDKHWTIVYDFDAKFYIAYLVKTDNKGPYIAGKSVLGESLLEAQASVNLIKGCYGVSRFFDDAGSFI